MDNILLNKIDSQIQIHFFKNSDSIDQIMHIQTNNRYQDWKKF